MHNYPRLTESYWPATRDEPLLDSSCAEIIRQAAAERANSVALIDADGQFGSRRQWTYLELFSASEQLAKALAKQFPKGT